MEQKDIWDAAAAKSYDTPGTGMFDPALRSRYADAARCRTEAKFALETTVSRYADLFRSLTSKAGDR